MNREGGTPQTRGGVGSVLGCRVWSVPGGVRQAPDTVPRRTLISLCVFCVHQFIHNLSTFQNFYFFTALFIYIYDT